MDNKALKTDTSLISTLDLVNELGLSMRRHNDIIRSIDRICAYGQYTFKEDTIRFADALGRKGKPIKYYLISNELRDVVVARLSGSLKLEYTAREKIALNTIEQVLGVKLLRQYPVLNYRIDGYDPVNNIAYEIDEPEHKYKKEQDEIRQRRIENELGCKFVRVNV
ncbi:TPA: DUF559 domain-containing protein [Escherichia coli]|nr:DUF559 domain-containing protein [Shigella sonnei]HBI9868511.1 DUF559 domain-containing protein [Escherichia coli]